MPISVSCPGCAARYAAPDKFAGKRMKCKACGAVVSVPEPELVPLDDDPVEAPRPFVNQGVGDLFDSELPASPALACPECGEKVRPGENACAACGHVLQKKRPAPVRRPSREDSDDDDEPKKKKKKKKKKSVGSLPTMCMAAFGIDIAFSLLKLGGGIVSIPELSRPEAQQLGLMFPLAVWTGLGVGVLGLAADVLMFAKQKWAWGLGYLAAAITAANIAFTAAVSFNTVQMMGRLTNNQAYATGAMVGLVAAVVVRGGLLLWYCSAVSQYQEWVEGPASES